MRRAVALLACFAGCIADGACAGAISPSEDTPAATSTWAYLAPDSFPSDSSLRAAMPHLDAIVSGVLPIDSITGLPTSPPAATRPLSDDRAAAFGTPRIVLVTTFTAGAYHPAAVRALASSAGALNLAASRIAALVAAGGYRTALLDFGGEARLDSGATIRVLRVIADTLHAHRLRVGVQISGADTIAYPTEPFVAIGDFLAVTFLDEHWPTSAPGPIASPRWVRRMLARRVADAGGDRIVAVLPTFSYLWRPGLPASMLSFDAARRVASEANVDLVRDPTSRSLHAVRPASWELWITDRDLIDSLTAEVHALGVRRVALWRLGLEDRRLWGSERNPR